MAEVEAEERGKGREEGEEERRRRRRDVEVEQRCGAIVFALLMGEGGGGTPLVGRVRGRWAALTSGADYKVKGQQTKEWQ